MEQIIVFTAAGMGIVNGVWSNMRIHRLNRLYRIRGGTGYYTVAGKTHQFERDHIYFLPWTVRYSLSQELSDPLDHVFIDFMSSFPGLCSKILDVTEAKDEICLNIVDLLLKMTETLSIEFNPGFFLVGRSPNIFDNYDYMMQAAVISFLSRLESIYGEKLPKEYEDIYRAVLYIHTHYSEPIDIDTLAAQSCLNKRYFIAKFKKIIGETPYHYLQSLRYDMAMDLHASGIPLNQAAEQVGFSAPSSIYRMKSANR